MTGKHYFFIELILFLILMGLSVSVYRKENKAAESGSKSTAQEKICYLTFDDGPSSNTEKILDILAEYEAKATFFIIGDEIQEDERQILERMTQEGHAVGLHSNVHDFDKLYINADACLKDYESEYEALKEEYGIETKLFRFPGGSACMYMNGNRENYIRKMQEKGYRCFDWNVSGEDSVGSPTVWSIQKNIFDHFFKYDKPIVLLHDSGIANMTVEALPGILERIKAEGYDFETLEEEEEYVYK